MRYLFFIVSVLWCINSTAQTTISGQITNQNKAVVGASIILSEIGEASALSFAISDTRGKYEMTFASALDSLQIKVSYLGYKAVKKIIPNKNQVLDFSLQKSAEALEEVVLEVAPIKKKGDTLSYNVSYFKNKKDRVIADVLKKMPGIDILGNGKILYQGKPIQKYYIEGLDLLEGRYNLANNNLPANAVEAVEVIENHQPVKLLDSLVYSDRASLNIKLKNKVATTGSGKLGVGAAPFLWSLNLTPMLFSKNQQLIASYQTNTIGDNVADDLNVLTLDELKSQLNQIKSTKKWVGIQEVSPPPFSEKLWLDNNVHLLSVNYLIRLKNEFQLKTNISYLNNFKKQVGRKQTTIYTPSDTVLLAENTNNAFFVNSFQSEFNLSKNTGNLFMENELSLNASWDSAKGKLGLGKDTLSQKTSTPFVSLQNNLKLIVPLGNLLATIHSDIGYTHTPQQLTVTPGQFQTILHQDVAYDKMVQNLTLTNFRTNNFIGFTKGFKGFSFQPKFGFQWQQEQLKSQIKTINNNKSTKLKDDFRNNLKLSRSALFAKLKVQYEINSWVFELNAPFQLRSFKREELYRKNQESTTRFTFEPQVSVTKKLNAFWETRLSASRKNNFGSINQSYSGYILSDYRSLRRFDSPFLSGITNSARLSVDYSNPLNALFASVSYAFHDHEKNSLVSNQINNQGLSTIKIIDRDNRMSKHTLSLRGSKYFNGLNTTLSLEARFTKSKNDQLINAALTKAVQKTAFFEGELDTNINSWLNLSYKSEFSFFNSFLAGEAFQKIESQKHALGLNFFLNDNHYLGLDAEFYKNNGFAKDQKNYFLNLSYRYTFENTGIDLTVDWNNILNTKYYSTAYNNSFSYVRSTYRLRPSQIVAAINFTF